jgi:hypothetical protein
LKQPSGGRHTHCIQACGVCAPCHVGALRRRSITEPGFNPIVILQRLPLAACWVCTKSHTDSDDAPPDGILSSQFSLRRPHTFTDRTDTRNCLIRRVLERRRPRLRAHGGESPPLHSFICEVNTRNSSTIDHPCSSTLPSLNIFFFEQGFPRLRLRRCL